MSTRWLQSSWLLPGAWMAVLYYVLTMEVDPEPPAWAFPHIDKVVHFGFFAVLAWLWYIPLRWSFPLSPMQAASLGFLLASLYGGITESIQSTLPHRHGNVWDVLANSLGAATVFVPALQQQCDGLLDLVSRYLRSE